MPHRTTGPRLLACLAATATATALTGCGTAQPAADTTSGSDLAANISRLTTAPEQQEDTYDRDAFGEYDRDAALDRNQAEYGHCDGYYSRYDDTCHTSADDVDIDETVARAEAWRSGAHAWGDAKLDAFGADVDNLSVMTSSVNRYDKSDADPADWRPATDTCAYAETWVAVKAEYGLSADRDEVAALEEMAAAC